MIMTREKVDRLRRRERHPVEQITFIRPTPDTTEDPCADCGGKPCACRVHWTLEIERRES